MIYTEFACYDKEYTADIKQQIFRAIGLGVGGISVPSIFLPHIYELMPEGITISCPIDYPDGRSDSKLRNHAIVKAIHKGANAVDLVANMVLYLNGKAKDFADDIKSSLAICKDHNVSLRVMADYRKAGHEVKKFIELWKTLCSLGITKGFVSTGYHVDNFADNIMLTKRIEDEFGISMICNGNIYLPEQYELITKVQCFGARFHNLNALERCYVGV